jgi:hypothetical protein
MHAMTCDAPAREGGAPTHLALGPRLRTAARVAAVLAATLSLGSAALRGQQAGGGDALTELAKKRENPVSDLVNVPLESDFSFGTGQYRRTGYTLNVQPVWPFKLSGTWNVIPRLILPVVSQPIGAEDRKSGLGDTTLALFLSPQEPIPWGAAGVVWGAGPVALLPTATSPLLGFQEWGAGATAAVIVTDGPWVTVALIQNLWSISGNVNQFLLQPGVTYNFEGGLAVSLGMDVAADWTQTGRDRWTVDLGPGVSKTFFLGKQAVSASLAAKPFLVRPPGAPAWVLQATLSFLFPK